MRASSCRPPVTQSLTIETPEGLTYALSGERQVDLTNPQDPLSLQTLTDIVTVNGRTSSSIFDAATRTLTDTSPEGRTSEVVIDEQGRPLETRVPDLLPLQLGYDTHGRLVSTVQGDRDSTLTYDATTGYLASTTNALSQSSQYQRDARGRLTTLTLADSTQWGYQWDAMDNLTVLTEPDGTTQHRFAYTADNLLQSYTSPLSATETFTYNRDKELIRREYPSGNGIDWVYNDQDQLTAVQTPEGNATFGYDATTGQLSQAVSRDGQQVNYSYDGSLLTQAAWSGVVDGSLGYIYDNDFRVTQWSYGGTDLALSYDDDSLLTGVGSISLTRDADNGLLTGITDGDFATTYAYNTYGELSSVTASQGGAPLYQVEYSYDALGRISQKQETIGGVLTTWDYTYDAVGQLIGVQRDGVEVESYDYDDVGNRIAVANSLTGQTLTAADYQYDADNELLRAGTATYQYDADGRLQEENRNGVITTYGYNTDGTLAEVGLSDGRIITYQHDHRGRRIARFVDGVRTHAWLYGGGLMPVAEYDGTGNLKSVFVYAAGATPVKIIQGGVIYHVVYDHLGSLRLILDETGNVVKRIDYDSYGNMIGVTGSDPDFEMPFGFAGGMSDPDHKLIRFGERDYQPATGRWIARDPILPGAGGRNLYEYSLNSPQVHTDRAGLCAEDACIAEAIVLKAAFDALLVGYVYYNTVLKPVKPKSTQRTHSNRNRVNPRNELTPGSSPNQNTRVTPVRRVTGQGTEDDCQKLRRRYRAARRDIERTACSYDPSTYRATLLEEARALNCDTSDWDAPSTLHDP
jgi:RHS repeat-associated protein